MKVKLILELHCQKCGAPLVCEQVTETEVGVAPCPNCVEADAMGLMAERDSITDLLTREQERYKSLEEMCNQYRAERNDLEKHSEKLERVIMEGSSKDEEQTFESLKQEIREQKSEISTLTAELDTAFGAIKTHEIVQSKREGEFKRLKDRLKVMQLDHSPCPECLKVLNVLDARQIAPWLMGLTDRVMHACVVIGDWKDRARAITEEAREGIKAFPGETAGQAGERLRTLIKQMEDERGKSCDRAMQFGCQRSDMKVMSLMAERDTIAEEREEAREHLKNLAEILQKYGDSNDPISKPPCAFPSRAAHTWVVKRTEMLLSIRNALIRQRDVVFDERDRAIKRLDVCEDKRKELEAELGMAEIEINELTEALSTTRKDLEKTTAELGKQLKETIVLKDECDKLADSLDTIRNNSEKTMSELFEKKRLELNKANYEKSQWEARVGKIKEEFVKEIHLIREERDILRREIRGIQYQYDKLIEEKNTLSEDLKREIKERDATEDKLDRAECELYEIRKTNCDDFNGHNFERETGNYNVAARDFGIEVCRNGDLIFSSRGAGKYQDWDTVEPAAERCLECDKEELERTREERDKLAKCLAKSEDDYRRVVIEKSNLQHQVSRLESRLSKLEKAHLGK